jgi:hypothetical protein
MARALACSPLSRRRHSGFGVCRRNLESLLPLPKRHSQTSQDLVKKSTLRSWNGGFK